MDSRRGKFRLTQDELLLKSIKKLGEKNWKAISKNVPGRNPVQCLHRWSKILQPGLIKGPWTIEEDRKLLSWVKREGPNKWANCAEFIKGRSGKQCRERWHNTLNPNVKKGNWEPEEDYLIFKLYQKYGTQWSKINQHFVRRTENSVKNRFYSTLRRLAADNKRKRVSSVESISDGNEPLLSYVSEAIKEKTIKLMRKYYSVNETTSNSDCLSNRMTENEELEYFNNIPLWELEKKIEDFCLNEKRIYERCIVPGNTQKEILDNHINSFIDNIIENRKEGSFIVKPEECNEHGIYIDQNQQKDECSENLDNFKEDYNHTSSLIEQLNDLEEILKTTKKNLLEKQSNTYNQSKGDPL